MNLFGTGAAGVLGSGSMPWLLISLGLGLVVLGMWCRKKICPRHVGAGDGQRHHRILPGFPRRDDLRGKDRVAGGGVIPFRARATLQPRLGDGEKEMTSKEEERAMRTSDRTIRNVTCLVIALMISAGLAACGGGGSSSPGTSGPAVSVSIASATSFPDGTTSAPSTDALSPATAAPPVNFQHLLVTVTKLALIPSTGEDKTVTDTFAPVTIDLLDLNSSTGDNVATLLNKFASVPAGEYSKIRVYYDNVVGQTGTDNILFHPTANSHFDVNFRGKNLVIPVTSDPGGGVEFYSVLINVVGKYHWAGKSPNVLLQPQVFATVVDGPLEYKVTGYADNVASDGTFDILALGGRSIPAAFSVDPSAGTEWAYSDNVLEISPWVIDRLASEAIPAFKNGAVVSAIGVFDSNLRLQASHITFSFPDVREGTADNVWIPPDNVAFVVHSGADNVVVFPAPDRFTAYYDNGTFPHPSLTQAAVVNGVQIKARGYNVAGGVEAFWLTVGEITVGP